MQLPLWPTSVSFGCVSNCESTLQRPPDSGRPQILDVGTSLRPLPANCALSGSGTPADLPSSGRWPRLVRLEWGEASEPWTWVGRQAPLCLMSPQCWAWVTFPTAVFSLLPPAPAGLEWSSWTLGFFFVSVSLQLVYFVLLLRIYLHNTLLFLTLESMPYNFTFSPLSPVYS